MIKKKNKFYTFLCDQSVKYTYIFSLAKGSFRFPIFMEKYNKKIN